MTASAMILLPVLKVFSSKYSSASVLICRIQGHYWKPRRSQEAAY
jgi:hypothetical protein